MTKDDNTRKWLSLMIPVNIPDQEDPKAVYPTIEHFLAGMKYKLFSNQPEKAALFQTTGFYGTSVAQLKVAAQAKAKKYYDLLTEQLTLIKKNLVGDKKTVFKEKTDSALFWKDEKMRLLKYALELRLEKDKDFQAAGTEVQTALGRAAQERGLATQGILAIRDAHTALLELYQQALRAADLATFEGQGRTDASLRGADRALQVQLDDLAHFLAQAYDRETEQETAAADSRYGELHLFLIICAGLGLFATGFLLVIELRRP
jgi:RNA binding exosome subunit